MNKICLFGASGHGKVVMDTALSLDVEVEAFMDDSPKAEFLNGIPVIKSKEMSVYKTKNFVISIGNNRTRKDISNRLSNDFATLIHKTAIISPTVNIGDGTVVMNGTNINANTIIGKHVIVNTGAVIEHDCKIEDFVHISPNSTITGNVQVGEGSHIGAGAVIIPNITIGKWTTIGAGAVVIEDVSDYAIVVGNPGKIKKYNNKYEF
jgi:acetyltransferase EpsM